MSRRLRYQVAMSLDGFIAGPNGESDWIVMDPSIDFGALFREFDTAVMGRKTYEALLAHGGNGAMPGLDVVVLSRTLPAVRQKGVRIVNDDANEAVAALKAKPGRDIWLFGGGALFRSLLDAGLVDTVEVAVIPVLLGSGIPVLPPGASTKLVLADQKTLPASGIIALSYSVPGSRGPAARIKYVKAGKTRRTPVASKGDKSASTPVKKRATEKVAVAKAGKGVQTRRANPSDAEAIAVAHLDSIRSIGPAFYSVEVVAAWGSGLTPDIYVNAMEGGEAFFVATGSLDGRAAILGFSTHRVGDEQDGASVYVRGSTARQGIGTALLRLAEEHARAHGAKSLQIQASLAGVEFYKANGFHETGRGEALLMSGRSMACVFMRKLLTGV